MKYLIKLYDQIQEKIWEWKFNQEMKLIERIKKYQEMDRKIKEMEKINADLKKSLQEKYGFDLSELD